MVTQMIEVLPPTWQTWTELLVHPNHSIQGVNKQMGAAGLSLPFSTLK